MPGIASTEEIAVIPANKVSSADLISVDPLAPSKCIRTLVLESNSNSEVGSVKLEPEYLAISETLTSSM